MKIILNILWFIFGGSLLAFQWFSAGLLLCITIVGIPFGVQCFKFAGLMLAPFGKEIVYSNKTSSLFLNILWILVFGLNAAIIAVIVGVLWCITIIGIPIGLQSFKFAQLAFMPFGAEIVHKRKDRYIFSN